MTLLQRRIRVTAKLTVYLGSLVTFVVAACPPTPNLEVVGPAALLAVLASLFNEPLELPWEIKE